MFTDHILNLRTIYELRGSTDDNADDDDDDNDDDDDDDGDGDGEKVVLRC